MAEVIKTAAISSNELFEYLEENAAKMLEFAGGSSEYHGNNYKHNFSALIEHAIRESASFKWRKPFYIKYCRNRVQ